MKLDQSRFHFIGIGGVGMSGLAELLNNMGASVSGSDLSENEHVVRLKNLGVTVYQGHSKSNLTPDTDCVVYSSAIDWTNPEIAEAQRLQIPIIRRAEVLAEIMRLKRGIAVGGSHGKTTTTSFLASIFLSADLDPTVVVGGRLDIFKSTAKLGKGEWLIAEADESDGSFLKLFPEIALVTNVDSDHLDHYGTFENIKKTFLEFTEKVPFYGFSVVCGDDSVTRDIFKDYPKKIFFYGFEKENDYVIHKEDLTYTLSFGEKVLGQFTLNMPGRHNGLNAAGALIVALNCGVDFNIATKGLRDFSGVDRRFQHKGDIGGVSFYDDYGHHPTEVLAVLKGFKERFPNRRLVVAFQPHRFSRTQLCWNDFLTCFEDANDLLLLDIYKASEKSIEGVTSRILADEIQHKSCRYISNFQEARKYLLSELKEGDIFLTLGAGDIYQLCDSTMNEMPK